MPSDPLQQQQQQQEPCSRNSCAKFHQNRLKTVTSRPELTDRQTYRHPTKEKIPYLVESETSLAQSIKCKILFRFNKKKPFGKPQAEVDFACVILTNSLL